jgi:hypothetical protein
MLAAGAQIGDVVAEGRLPAVVPTAGQPADIAGSAYLYRADRRSNPPEAWVLLMQHAGLPFEQPVDTNAPAMKQALCGLLWEEVRPVRRVVLSWPREAKNKPRPAQIVLSYFNSQDDTAHTWWNPRSSKEAGLPEVSADGCSYTYVIAEDTWGVVASVRDSKLAAGFAVPAMQAFVEDHWKQMEVEIEWGYETGSASLAYDGRVEAYDGRIFQLRPLAALTKVTGANSWQSPGAQPPKRQTTQSTPRRGISFRLLYIGDSRWRKVWPYHAQPEDVARTIVTVWTASGNFSFLAADLERGPILAPEYGFFVRATAGKRSGTLGGASLPPPRSFSPPPKALLEKPVNEIPSVPLIRGWCTGEIPWFGANPTAQPGVNGNLRIPPRCVAMHPLPDRDVAVGWRSPLSGGVRIQASVAMGDATGQELCATLGRRLQHFKNVRLFENCFVIVTPEFNSLRRGSRTQEGADACFAIRQVRSGHTVPTPLERQTSIHHPLTDSSRLPMPTGHVIQAVEIHREHVTPFDKGSSFASRRGNFDSCFTRVFRGRTVFSFRRRNRQSGCRSIAGEF